VRRESEKHQEELASILVLSFFFVWLLCWVLVLLLLLVVLLSYFIRGLVLSKCNGMYGECNVVQYMNIVAEVS
jgi:hypothetical protein